MILLLITNMEKITLAIIKTPPYADSIFIVTVLSFATETTEDFGPIFQQSLCISLFSRKVHISNELAPNIFES